MHLPVVHGVIERRLLVNVRVDPRVAERIVPLPFRPRCVRGHAIAGVCLIRLADLRPRGVPRAAGLGSENAAHRIAVEWDSPGGIRQGVYIPRRDTDSRLVWLAGGRLFPGAHHLASFSIEETDDAHAIRIRSRDDDTRVELEGRVTDRLPDGSVFRTLSEASAFLERGAIGYSATREPGRFDGLELRCEDWHVEPLAIERFASSFLDALPRGSVELDHALRMRGIRHAWRTLPDLRAGDPAIH